jgi:hypothetical protein
MRGLGALGAARSLNAAMMFAAEAENSGIPWNSDPSDPNRLTAWRSPEGYNAVEVMTRIRAAHPDLLDPRGEWAENVASFEEARLAKELVGARGNRPHIRPL